MPAGALRPKLRAQDSSRNKNRRPEARQAVGLPESTRIQRLGTVGIIVVTASPWLSAPKTLHCTCEACCRKTINCCTLRPLCSDAATSFDRHIIQRILESEQERCRKNRLCDLGSNTYTHTQVHTSVQSRIPEPSATTRHELTSIQTSGSLLVVNLLQCRNHALFLRILTRHMGPRLDGDVRISDARGSQLAQGTQHERVCRSHFPSLLECLLQLLENRVLQDGVHDEDQCWQDTGEETEEAIFTDDLEESRNGAGLGGVDLSLLALLERESLGGLVFTSRHACVDDPDGVGEENGGRAGERSRSHRLESGELFLPRGPLEEGTRELIPIVVDKVRHGNAKERAVQTRVQTHDALAVNDALGCIQGAG